MLGKLVNGELITPSDKEKEKIVITRPTDDMLKYIRGYKDVTETEPPEYDEETQYLEAVYTETDTAVNVSYEVKEMDFSEEYDASLANLESDN